MEDNVRKQEKKKTKVLIIILTIITIIIILLLLLRCSGNKEPEIIENKKSETSEVVHKEEKVGGYVEAKDKTISPELKDIFERATANITDIKYEPEELVATQVVSGTNYKFLATGTSVAEPTNKQKYYIYIYENLQGEAEVIDVEEIVEPQHTKEIINDDEKVESLLYYVVFYDQYGNELQREVLPYGTTPSFKGYYPEGFDNWDKAINPIAGNTYYYAQCHEVHHSSSDTPSTPSEEDIDYGFLYNTVYQSIAQSGQTKIVLNAIFTKYKVNGKEQVLVEQIIYNNGNEIDHKSNCNDFTVTPGNPTTISIDDQNGPITVTVGEKLVIENFQGFRFEFNVYAKNYIDGAIDGFAYKGNTIMWLLKKDESITIPSSLGGNTITIVGGEFNKYRNTYTSLTIPRTIQEIKNSAFSDSRQLTMLTFENNSSLNKIGEGAFKSCIKLNKVMIPKSVTSIGKSAFEMIGKEQNDEVQFEFENGSTLEKIPEFVCYNSSKIKKITLPNTVKKIEEKAFEGNNLTQLNFGNSTSIEELGYQSIKNKTSEGQDSDKLFVELPSTLRKLYISCVQIPVDNLTFSTNFPTKWILYTGADVPVDGGTFTLPADIDDFKKALTGEPFSKSSFIENNAYFVAVIE